MYKTQKTQMPVYLICSGIWASSYLLEPRSWTAPDDWYYWKTLVGGWRVTVYWLPLGILGWKDLLHKWPASPRPSAYFNVQSLKSGYCSVNFLLWQCQGSSETDGIMTHFFHPYLEFYSSISSRHLTLPDRCQYARSDHRRIWDLRKS